MSVWVDLWRVARTRGSRAYEDVVARLGEGVSWHRLRVLASRVRRRRYWIYAPLSFFVAWLIGIIPSAPVRQACIDLRAIAPGVRRMPDTPVRWQAQATSAEVHYADHLPPALATPLGGPALHVGTGRLIGTQARSSRAKSPRARPQAKPRTPARRPGRLRVRAVGRDRIKVEYRVGAPVRPQVVRLPERAQLRVILPADAQSKALLARPALAQRGVDVVTRKLGDRHISVDVSCPEDWTIGTARANAKGWAIWIKRDPALSLR